MKKIVNWKRYDTDTAAFVAEWGNGGCRTDHHHCSETLYRTRIGNWFLYGEGGALSPYREPGSTQNSFEPGATIIPLTEREAASWMAEKVPDLFDDYFAYLAQDA